MGFFKKKVPDLTQFLSDESRGQVLDRLIAKARQDLCDLEVELAKTKGLYKGLGEIISPAISFPAVLGAQYVQLSGEIPALETQITHAKAEIVRLESTKEAKNGQD